ncbi:MULTISPECIES: hypothetical protein [unclassified Flavobacterium]|uniref:hypothetical protein n=1 Tax=unclassified Flavobacterium TaxID=196869 RepID=UPI0012928FA6|nr:MULTISPECIES: hypothetical protein [unclassified Flavobacterium]MQP52060.1 hypothetical protein [Flavobacterium sp. LMO9]MQP61929.1 hypothetical protein [Flavobacterium sp. LMO6]
MYNGNLKSKIKVHLSNIPGWRTKRKIVVIESDDWGSIRMASCEAFANLVKAGIPVNKSHYNTYDALESNTDLELLFETLSKFRDKTNRPPVFTGVTIVANPNFEKIKASGYTEYFYEPFTETAKRYEAHDKVFDLWKMGIENRLMVPVFHGREHLNVQRWMRELQKDNPSLHLAFENQITGISKGINSVPLPDLQAAFDIDTKVDLLYMHEVLTTGLQLFEELFGFKSAYFVPTNGPFNNTLEPILLQNGVKYINTGKKQLEPLGNREFKTNIRFLGQKNQLGQTYITRNCFFEPSSMQHSENTDWIGNCLKEIEIAFRWNKPAVISTHRVNYIGYLVPQNREHSLKKLEVLLSIMLKRWPDIEFMTTSELGNLIKNESNHG